MNLVMSIVVWLVSAMIGWVPLTDHRGNGDTQAQTEQRYEDIALDALKVAFDENEKPIFSGEFGRTRTALLMLAISRWESNYAKRIDSGDCRKGECDNGMAMCIMQVHAEGGGLVLEGDTYKFANSKSKVWRDEHSDQIIDLKALKDRKNCFRAALHKIRESFMACSWMSVEDRLGIYTGEGCKKDAEGHPKPNMLSRTRVKTYLWAMNRTVAIPVNDAMIAPMFRSVDGLSVVDTATVDR
jgi:hypothetical protein